RDSSVTGVQTCALPICTFPPAPGSRTVTIVLHPVPPPFGFAGPYFEGRLFQGGVDKGSFSMGWVSSFFRRAKVEVDTLTGAVAQIGRASCRERVEMTGV